MTNDPVCRKEINPRTSEWLVGYQGQAYHFCTSACRDKFVETPSEFALVITETPVRSVVASSVEAVTAYETETKVSLAQ